MTRVAVVLFLLATAALSVAVGGSGQRRCPRQANCNSPAYYRHPCCQSQQLVPYPLPQPLPYPLPQPLPYPLPQPLPIPSRCPRETNCSSPVNAPSPCCMALPYPPPQPLPYPPPQPLPYPPLQPLPYPPLQPLPYPPLQPLPYPLPQPLPYPPPLPLPYPPPQPPPVYPCPVQVNCSVPVYPQNPCCQPMFRPYPPPQPLPYPPIQPRPPPPVYPCARDTKCGRLPPYYPSPCCQSRPQPLPYPPPQPTPMIDPRPPPGWIAPLNPSEDTEAASDNTTDSEEVAPPPAEPWIPPPRPMISQPMIYPPMPSRCGMYGPSPPPPSPSSCPFQANRRVRRRSQRQCSVDAQCPAGSFCCRSGCSAGRSVCVPSVRSPSPGPRPNAMRVSVVFTSSCTQALWFLKTQVAPFVHALPHLLNLELIPYGRVNEEGECQFGLGDCLGNWLVSCAARHLPPSPALHLAFTTCLMNHTHVLQTHNFTAIMDVALQCAVEYPDKIPDLYKCGVSEEGFQLFEDAGRRQRELAPVVTHVPLVAFNEVAVLRHSSEMGDFPDLLCRELQEDPLARGYCQLIEASRQEANVLE